MSLLQITFSRFALEIPTCKLNFQNSGRLSQSDTQDPHRYFSAYYVQRHLREKNKWGLSPLKELQIGIREESFIARWGSRLHFHMVGKTFDDPTNPFKINSRPPPPPDV